MFYLQRLNNHIIKIMVWMLLALFFIIIRLFILQISYADHYQTKGQKNFLRVETTPPQRGNIIDSHGRLLATNKPVNHLVWNGTGNRTLSGIQLQMIKEIESITGSSLLDNLAMRNKLYATERYYRHTILVKDITLDQLSKITERYADSSNLSIKTEFQRHYPHGSCASHIVGYLSRSVDAPTLGQMGIERICDNALKGRSGSILKTINSFGQHIQAVELEAVDNGGTIQTTIDLELQKIAESIFPEQYQGCILIMDPNSGAIKSLVSRPQFDPALFLRPIGQEEWQQLQEKKPFLNRALNSYPPGSIFKLVTISAALEHNYLSADQNWQCHGFVPFAGRKYWCHRRWGHGELNTMQAVAQSCNILFYEIGKKIDIDLIAQYAHQFGLGEPTGIILPERTGLVPSREWKAKHRSERWWPGETLSVAIGQSFLLASPLQITRMISSIFTGNLVKPRLLEQEEIVTTPLSLKDETISFLKDSMRFVVTTGTGKRVNAVKDIEIYAKTSTAQVSDFSKRKESTNFLEHAWFVGYFKYKEYPPLAFTIVIENAGTSQVATTVAKQLLLAYKNIAHTL